MRWTASEVPVLGAVPIKPFQAAKGRLAVAFNVAQRRQLAEFLGKRTLDTLRQAGVEAVVLAADEEVSNWAIGIGYPALVDSEIDLNQAAASAAAIAAASARPWLLVHADLPLLDVDGLKKVLEWLNNGRPVLAASPDGGTPLLGWTGADFVFRYGPSSFQRHLRQLASYEPYICRDPRISFDIDHPRDVAVALTRNQDLAARLSSLADS